MLARQSGTQRTILPLTLAPTARPFQSTPFIFVHPHAPSKKERALTHEGEPIWYEKNGTIYRLENGIETGGSNLTALPPITFTQNWLFICAALHAQGYAINHLIKHAQALKPLPHRLEPIAHHAGVTIYNDSKATTPASMAAAVCHLAKQHGRVALIVGGLSKGVDRRDMFKNLPRNSISAVWCFGDEAKQLYAASKRADLPAYQFATLEKTIEHCMHHLGDARALLFSPAGSSFDLFAHYQARGETFTNLVHAHCATRP